MIPPLRPRIQRMVPALSYLELKADKQKAEQLAVDGMAVSINCGGPLKEV